VAAGVSRFGRSRSTWEYVQKRWIEERDAQRYGGKVAATSRAIGSKVIVARRARRKARSSGPLRTFEGLAAAIATEVMFLDARMT